jgi:hypothetical protein
MKKFDSCSAVVVLSLCAITPTVGAQPEPPQIVLPEIVAIELPRGLNEVGPSDPVVQALLRSARSGTRTVTSDLQGKIGVGSVRVTWSAWDQAPGVGKPAATRTETMFVLPSGVTPVGVSGDENATGGNNAVRIARDSIGSVHMLWVDSGRPGAPTGPVYRRAAVAPDGSVRLETDPIYVADSGPSEWNAYPALAVRGEVVQLAWQGGGSVRTRRLVHGPTGWTFGPVRDTGAKSEGRDIGPAIAIDPSGLHIVTPSGVYAFSSDGGQSWKTETIPVPARQRIKTASLAVDPSGVVHFVFSAVVARTSSPAQKLGEYWQLLGIDRRRDGTWTELKDLLAGIPGWSEPSGSDDVLADWVRIAADQEGGLHVVWHGTATTRRYGKDAAFYAFRRQDGAWQLPLRLINEDPGRGILSSFAPSLVLDGEHALPLTFYDVYSGPKWIGFDSALSILRRGMVEAPFVPVTQFVRVGIDAKRLQGALSVRFPAAAPLVWHGPDGRLWLDVLERLKVETEPGPHLIVYQRLELSPSLRTILGRR